MSWAVLELEPDFQSFEHRAEDSLMFPGKCSEQGSSTARLACMEEEGGLVRRVWGSQAGNALVPRQWEWRHTPSAPLNGALG